MSVLFITGIDTDIGKTVATGLLAKALQQLGCNVITQKLVQTGCEGISEDIITHRELMQIPIQAVDKDKTTCPFVFSKPASPHLSSSLESVIIEPDIITGATNKLKNLYDVILLEGAGGLMVPITDSLLTLDYIAAHRYPIILVTSGRLGSINHTLLSLKAISARSLPLHAVIYNHWQPNESHLVNNYQRDDQIVDNTQQYLQSYLSQHHPDTYWVNLESHLDNDIDVNISNYGEFNSELIESKSSINSYAEQIIQERNYLLR